MYGRRHGSRSTVALLRNPHGSWSIVLGNHARAAVGALDDDICDAVAGLEILGNGVVVPRGVGGDNVPGVQEARDEAEDAEADVDYEVGGAETGFGPNLRWC